MAIDELIHPFGICYFSKFSGLDLAMTPILRQLSMCSSSVAGLEGGEVFGLLSFISIAKNPTPPFNSISVWLKS